MNKNSVKDFRPGDGRMDKVKKVLKECTYICSGDDFDVYNFECTTICVYKDGRIRIGGKLPMTRLYGQSQLEEKAKIELKEIK
ncbi:hypothetical protein ES703_85980 [subsurface metagenome]